MEALWKEMEAQLKPLEGFVKGFETRKAAVWTATKKVSLFS